MEGAQCCDKLCLSAVGGEVDSDVSSGGVARKGEEEGEDGGRGGGKDPNKGVELCFPDSHSATSSSS